MFSCGWTSAGPKAGWSNRDGERLVVPGKGQRGRLIGTVRLRRRLLVAPAKIVCYLVAGDQGAGGGGASTNIPEKRHRDGERPRAKCRFLNARPASARPPIGGSLCRLEPKPTERGRRRGRGTRTWSQNVSVAGNGRLGQAGDKRVCIFFIPQPRFARVFAPFAPLRKLLTFVVPAKGGNPVSHRHSRPPHLDPPAWG